MSSMLLSSEEIGHLGVSNAWAVIGVLKGQLNCPFLHCEIID